MLVLTGRSCSGKDTVLNKLVSDFGYQKMITYTTRPMRLGEVQDKTYHFITTEEFQKKANNKEFLEINYYATMEGIWAYGSTKEDYINSKMNTVCILEPNGVSALQKNNIDAMIIYLDVTDEEILQRQKERGDNKEEAQRRFESDKKDFENINQLAYFVIDNGNSKDINDVARLIDVIHTNAGYQE